MTLTRDTWYGHILVGHPEMQGKVQEVKAVVASPVIVMQNIDPAKPNLIFADPAITLGGSPLSVIVHPTGGIVISSYFDHRLQSPPQNWAVIWQKP